MSVLESGVCFVCSEQMREWEVHPAASNVKVSPNWQTDDWMRPRVLDSSPLHDRSSQRSSVVEFCCKFCRDTLCDRFGSGGTERRALPDSPQRADLPPWFAGQCACTVVQRAGKLNELFRLSDEATCERFTGQRCGQGECA